MVAEWLADCILNVHYAFWMAFLRIGSANFIENFTVRFLLRVLNAASASPVFVQN